MSHSSLQSAPDGKTYLPRGDAFRLLIFAALFLGMMLLVVNSSLYLLHMPSTFDQFKRLLAGNAATDLWMPMKLA
jgi:hypothetical protein